MQQFEKTVTTIHNNELSIEDHTQDGIRILTVRGEIDDDVCPQLSTALHIEPGTQTPRLIADLSGVTFMDSTGINAFATAYHAVTTAGGWLRIAAPSPPVARVLNLVGLDTLIDCHPNLEQALTA
ncbi:STAS domain-containing protein [Streptomyces tauricus]|uniref:STAS domain-containing protein n=1 Tax=Streptomyces tauricus TaxID=68274 RepID=UPI0037FDE59C